MFEVKYSHEEMEAMLYDIAVKSGVFVPINKNSYRYKNWMVIKGPDDCWHIFQIEPKKKKICSTFLKISAFTVCKLIEKRKLRNVDEIVRQDGIFRKNYIDSIFYRNTFKKTKDRISKDNALWRYEIVYIRAKLVKDQIEKQFYSSLA